MESIKPRTYNELMQYKRCLELKRLIPEIDGDLFVKVYQHMVESKQNSIGASDGKLTFYQDKQAIRSFSIAVDSAYTAINLSSMFLNIQRPYSYDSSGDGGSSGNNNNNNNNNNNG